MISEADIEKAVDYLRDSAKQAAQSRADVKYLEAHMKVLKATLKAKSAAGSNAAAEDEALAHPDYRVALEGYRAAVEKDAEFTFLREAADAKIRAWQTMSASARAEGRAYG